MVMAGETEVLGENLHRLHFVHHKSHLPNPGANRRGGKPETNRFSYGAADINIDTDSVKFFLPFISEYFIMLFLDIVRLEKSGKLKKRIHLIRTFATFWLVA
jgi:hypothetical protein